jgi:CheY-like chemotaxis protein/glycine cleavage system H lipoate-binding protein
MAMRDKIGILAVDDEQVILDAAEKTLAPEGFQVLTALDAEAAVQILKADGPDIVISDLVLPGASGMELLESALKLDPAILVIIVSGYSSVENAVAALKRGAFDFLPKPFTVEELLSCVHRARRAVELRLAPEARIPGPERGGDSHLGLQSWVRMEEGGSALMGVTEFMVQTIAPVERVEFPDVGAELRQGGRLGRLLTKDGLAHTVWSPLGGRVLVCNDRLRDQPEALCEDPCGSGWIARVLPGDPDGELVNLT